MCDGTPLQDQHLNFLDTRFHFMNDVLRGCVAAKDKLLAEKLSKGRLMTWLQRKTVYKKLQYSLGGNHARKNDYVNSDFPSDKNIDDDVGNNNPIFKVSPITIYWRVLQIKWYWMHLMNSILIIFKIFFEKKNHLVLRPLWERKGHHYHNII